MKKSERGILAVEASMVLTFILLAILFLFGFGRVYRAQSLVGHAVIQTADAVALESYLRETALQGDAAAVKKLANEIASAGSISSQDLESLRSANLPSIAKKKFIYAIESSETRADEKLKNVGVSGGISGIDFTECKMDLKNDDVIIAISYTLEMQFPLFGAKEIPMTKTAKAKTFGEILFEVTTSVNNPGWGTTTGDTKVTHGSSVQITATPNYGYVFKEWSDGSKDQTRIVTVTDAQHYVAIFAKDKFGINLSVNNSAYGTVLGGGTYEYQTVVPIEATPKAHYQFVGWDDNGDGIVDNKNSSRNITVDKTYHLKAYFKPVQYKITVRSNNTSFGTVNVSQGVNISGSSIMADYGSRVNLNAVLKNTTLYRFVNWNNGNTNTSQTVTVSGNAEYTANFDYNTYTVNFYNGNSLVHATKVIRNSSISASSAVGGSWPSDPWQTGASFGGWTYNGSSFTNGTKVYGTINVHAQWNCTVTFNGNGGYSPAAITVAKGSYVNFGNYSSSRNGFNFNGWYNGNTKCGNVQVNSDMTVTASWSCLHPDRKESSRSGSICTGGTIYYKCTQCNCDMGTGSYGGIGHSWTARCNRRHKLNYFNGCVIGGCGKYHGTPAYSTCQVCVYCSKLRSKYNWCASSHMLQSAKDKPKRYPSEHNFYNSSVEF